MLGSERFEVLTLSIDRAGVSVVRRFFDEIGIGHLATFIKETMKASRDLRIFDLPGTLLVGPAEWDTSEMVAFFEGVIAEYAGKESTQ